MENFLCVYCGHTHPAALNSDEHIIPQSLKNKNYVLKNACRLYNNYMAQSFENEVKNFGLIQELLLIIDPPNKPRFRGEAHSDINKEVFRYVLPSGENEFTEHPKHVFTNNITVPVKDLAGNIQFVDLLLPFEVRQSITTPDRFVQSKDEVIRKEKNNLEQYLMKLAHDPSIHPSFNKFLKDNGFTFTISKLKVSEEAVPLPNTLEVIHAQQHFPVNIESLFKFYMKIAWTHGVKQLGSDKMSNNIGNWILNYIISGHLTQPDLYESYPNLFTNPVVIENESYIFWDLDINQTGHLIDEIDEPKSYGAFLALNETRRNNLHIAKSLVVTEFPHLNFPDIIAKKEKIRNHTLSLKSITFMGKLSTVCMINLFGNLLQATVKLSDYPLTDIYPEDVIIEF